MSSPGDIEGLTVVDDNGDLIFIHGKNRVKITEHFDPNGKTIGDIITELIIAKSKEKVTKIA